VAVDQAKLDNWFAYHRVKPEQRADVEAIRKAAKHFARTVLEHTPACPDHSTAIRKIREAMFIAHASITCSGR
jgi:hypothetical protein